MLTYITSSHCYDLSTLRDVEHTVARRVHKISSIPIILLPEAFRGMGHGILEIRWGLESARKALSVDSFDGLVRLLRGANTPCFWTYHKMRCRE